MAATTMERETGRRGRPVQTIGWREWVALPDLGVDAIKVKVDTGARSSALHAFNLEEYEVDGQPWVRFELHPIQRDSSLTLIAEYPLADRRWVRSSSGRTTLRPVIRTPIRLGDRVWKTEVTLVRRDMMGFRMLLGRRAVRRRFLVDCGKSFLFGGAPEVKRPRRRKTKRSTRTGDKT